MRIFPSVFIGGLLTWSAITFSAQAQDAGGGSVDTFSGGTLILTGSSTYTGSTYLSYTDNLTLDGSLQKQADGSLSLIQVSSLSAVSGATLTVNSASNYISTGTLTLDAGTISLNTGTLNLYNGFNVLSGATLSLGTGTLMTGTLNVTGGSLILANAFSTGTTGVLTVANGGLTATGTLNLNLPFTLAEDSTVPTLTPTPERPNLDPLAVPEPSSIVLLLGGVAIFGRRLRKK